MITSLGRSARFLITSAWIGIFFGIGIWADTPLCALTEPSDAQSSVGLSHPIIGHGLNLNAMDTSIQPGDDFYQYANGHWLATTVLPANEDQYGPGSEDTQGNLFQLRNLAEKAAADQEAVADSSEGRVGSFYRSGMDEAQIEADAATPLNPELARIDAIHDIPTLEVEIAALHRLRVFAGFQVDVGPDAHDSMHEVLQFTQGGIGLPDPIEYCSPGTDGQTLRAAYIDHVADMFQLLHESPAQSYTDAEAIMALETRLASASATPSEMRDVRAIDHSMSVAGLNSLTPGIDWQIYFTALGVPEPGTIRVGQPQFFTALGQIMAGLPLADWRAYLRWNFISTEAACLNQAFVSEDFHFYGTVLQGIRSQPPRWKMVLGRVDASLGEDLGHLYVAQAFSPEAKAKALALAQNVQAALQEKLITLPWMGDVTRREARLKLAAMVIKVGYPDHWHADYASLDISDRTYVVNRMRADAFAFNRSLAKIGHPVDRQEWNVDAATPNAWYDPSLNAITLPAGMLLPPYFDPTADDAVNYGAIGVVIGHEMTHGFDDRGRQFDDQGNLRDWWTSDDARAFETRAQSIVAQYSAYEPLPGLHIDGKLTESENIADIGGLKIAYLALERSLQGKERPIINGFTPEQRFFLSFAQSWQRLTRPEAERVWLTTNPHSPERFRVLGSLANMPEFRAAFHCPSEPISNSSSVW